jgi:hypothetical protein
VYVICLRTVTSGRVVLCTTGRGICSILCR